MCDIRSTRFAEQISTIQGTRRWKHLVTFKFKSLCKPTRKPYPTKLHSWVELRETQSPFRWASIVGPHPFWQHAQVYDRFIQSEASLRTRTSAGNQYAKVQYPNHF